MPDFQPQVLKVTQQTDFQPNGQSRISYGVNFAVGPHGPFTISVPASEFSAASVRARLDQFARELEQLPMGV